MALIFDLFVIILYSEKEFDILKDNKFQIYIYILELNGLIF